MASRVTVMSEASVDFYAFRLRCRVYVSGAAVITLLSFRGLLYESAKP